MDITRAIDRAVVEIVNRSIRYANSGQEITTHGPVHDAIHRSFCEGYRKAALDLLERIEWEKEHEHED